MIRIRYVLCFCFYMLCASVCPAQSDGKALDALMDEMGWEGIRIEYTLAVTTSLSKAELDARWKKVEKYPDHPERGSIEFMRNVKDHPQIQRITAWYAGNSAYLREMEYESGMMGGDAGRSLKGRRLNTGGQGTTRWMYSGTNEAGQLTKIHSGIPFPMGYNLNQLLDDLRSDLEFMFDIGRDSGSGVIRDGLIVHREGKASDSGGADFYRYSSREYSNGRLEQFELLGVEAVSVEQVRAAGDAPLLPEGARVVDFNDSAAAPGDQGNQALMGVWNHSEGSDRFDVLSDEDEVVRSQGDLHDDSKDEQLGGKWIAYGIGAILVVVVVVLMKK